MNESEKEVVKQALKEGLKEWMEEKFTLVGKWTVRAVIVALFSALMYMILLTNGWKPPSR